MTLTEFNQRTNAHLNEDQYKSVENMYMEAGDMDKDQFCSEWTRHNDSQLLQLFFNQSEDLRSQNKALNDQIAKLAIFLIDQAEKWGASDLREKAVQLLGIEKYLTIKLQKGYQLWDDDRQELIQILCNK